MSTQTGKWREDQILVVCPGSQTTMAHLGCAELTPPSFRFPTRMFNDDESGDWRPYYTYKRAKANAVPAANGDDPVEVRKDEDEWEYVEDPDSTEGAVYPMEGGRIVNMDAFLAFLEHVHSMLTTTYHNTPIMLMASPQWTRPDCETIAQYIFEKTRTPALCLIHSGIATQYGLRWPHLTVVDIGFEKVDVTCIFDSRVVNHTDVGFPADGGPERDISGGEVFTQRLKRLLKGKQFSYDMAEQLKKSPICEVLPYAPEHPQLADLPQDSGAIVAAAAASASAVPIVADVPSVMEPARTAGYGGEDDGVMDEDKAVDIVDGVLDVASIVTSGQTKEFLAKREKEKATKTGKRGKAQEADAAAAKPTRLPNAKRLRSIFHYEEFVQEDNVRPKESAAKNQEVEVVAPAKAVETSGEVVPTAEVAKPEGSTEQQQPPTNGGAVNGNGVGHAPAPDALSFFPSAEPAAAPAPPAVPEVPERTIKRIRRDIDVGLERFTFADRAEIDRIVSTIYRTVQGIEDMYMRPSCWENIVFVGNGGRIRGLKENILQTLTARHLISPSSATMFTSELPSNLATPSGTGSQTPTGSFTGAPHQLPTSSSVNPLLQAATTASLALPPAAAAAPGSNAGDPAAAAAPSHHFHSQTPTAIKLAPLPSYLSEWTKNGFEEAMFLGAQVAARLAFCVHNMDAQGHESQRLMSLSRVDYNELGPKGVRTHSMLG